MKTLKSIPIKLIIATFAVDTLVMIVELCASYLAYPYFGNANAVWIAIITMILLGNSIGNIIGGKLSQKSKETGTSYISTAFLIASMLIGFILLLTDIVFPVISSIIHSFAIAALIGSLLLFLPCTICFGTIAPQVMYAMSQKEGYTGESTGTIYALSTAGGLFGTLIGGFVLVPALGCRTILIFCICVAIIVGLVEFTNAKGYKSVMCVFIALMCITVSVIKQIKTSDWTNRPYGYAIFDSEYNRITLANSTENGKPIRIMSMASGFESMTYLDEDKYELMFEYMKTYDEFTLKNPDVKSDNLLLIGGAAFQFPKYVLTHYENTKIDVVEIDPEVVKLAKHYFFLHDCIDQYDPMGERMGITIADGRKYIENTDKRYDVIYNDAFSGDTPPATLTTTQFIQMTKNALIPTGIYAINIVDKAIPENAKWLQAEAKTLSLYFKNIYIVQCVTTATGARSNYVIFASDNEINIADVIDLDYSNAITLTDDYHPIDSLLR